MKKKASSKNKKENIVRETADTSFGQEKADTKSDSPDQKGVLPEDVVLDIPDIGSFNEEENPEQKEITELKDRYMRLLAEYDNFRKRSRTQMDNIYIDATVDSVKEWISVVDNIDRAMEYQESGGDETAGKIAEGVALIKKQAMEVLAKQGVEEIVCEQGAPFDPNFHAAVAHIEDESLGEHCIAMVFQKGYIKGDRVIRYAMVQVAN